MGLQGVECRLIVNADDLGASDVVNDAIFHEIEKGRVTSATILANGPSVDKIAKEAKKFPYASFGVHLNLTEYHPLSSDPALKPILNANGELSNKLDGAPGSVPKTVELFWAIIHEWSLQIERLQGLGLQVSHFDSHQHVHTLPFLFPAVKYIQRKYGVNKVRISKNIYRPEENVGKGKMLAKTVYNTLLRNLGQTTATDGFTDLCTYVDVGREKLIPYRTVELMVQPGTNLYPGEREVLGSDWLTNLPFKACLTSYHEL
jgi:predicted glycoside hydrolase/deacetylase ChbG (UPF0249 family)